MQTATSETQSKSRDLSICAHHYTLRVPWPKGQEIESTQNPNPTIPSVRTPIPCLLIDVL